jgi:hypothetical protein
MSWLERLKAHDSDTRGVGGHCQNRQNPGSVSFDGASIARIPSNQGANADPWADRAVALHSGYLHQCRACRHFSETVPRGGDNLGVQGTGWCHQYLVAAHPFVPFVCDGYCPNARDG